MSEEQALMNTEQTLLNSEEKIVTLDEKIPSNEENNLNNEQIAEILYRNTPCKQCIYISFRIFIYILVLVGIGDLLGSILVYTSTKTLDWYNGMYALLGLVITFLAAFSHMTQESVKGTCCYLFILFLSFLGQLGTTLGIIFYTDYIALLGLQNAQTVRYAMLSTAALMFVAFIVGIGYYSVILKENRKRDEYNLLYGEPPDTMEPVVGVNLWRKYERTMVRWNRIFS